MFECASVNIEVKVDKPSNCNANSLACVQVQCQANGNLAAANEAAWGAYICECRGRAAALAQLPHRWHSLLPLLMALLKLCATCVCEWDNLSSTILILNWRILPGFLLYCAKMRISEIPLCESVQRFFASSQMKYAFIVNINIFFMNCPNASLLKDTPTCYKWQSWTCIYWCQDDVGMFVCVLRWVFVFFWRCCRPTHLINVKCLVFFLQFIFWIIFSWCF